jgi:hypothetical protein
MESGGERLSQTLEGWSGEKRESGWNQALIASTEGGKRTVKPSSMVEISNMWGVPLPQIMDAAKKANEPITDQQIKDGAKTFYLALENIVREGQKPDEKAFQKLVKDSFSEDLDPREVSIIAMQIFQQTVPQIKESLITTKKDDMVFRSVNGEINPIPVIDRTGEDPEKLYPVPPDVKLVTSKGKEVARGLPGKGGVGSEGGLTQKDMAADIRAAAQKLTGIEAGENIVKEIMATPANTAARKELKRQLLVMIKEYEERFGVSAARAVGFDTTLSKPEKKKAVVRSGIQNGKKVVEYDDGSVEYAD